MGILPDKTIRELAIDGMIEPFSEKLSQKGVISHGLSSFGYDARIGNKFKIFSNIKSTVIDPKIPTSECFVEHEGDDCIIPPNSYVLAHTVEKFKIPRDILVVCLGKSTYARWGIIVNVTPLEPEWEGTVTLEISNSTPCPVKIYANEGICQLLFFRGESACEISYADRGGKYQGQAGITLGMISERDKPKKDFTLININGVADVYNLDDLIEVAESVCNGGRIRFCGGMEYSVQMVTQRLNRIGRFAITSDNASNALLIERE